MSVTGRPEIHISADVEADGPIPGPFSMLSIGLCVAGRLEDGRYAPADPSARTFYRELQPISEAFDPGALAVSGLDRDRLSAEGANPAQAMADARQWVLDATGPLGRPVLVAWPLAFDWAFIHWYFVRFVPAGDPFGFSGAIDMKSWYAARAGCPLEQATMSRLPAQLRPGRTHAHHALDDAVEQAEIWSALVRWPGPTD